MGMSKSPSVSPPSSQFEANNITGQANRPVIVAKHPSTTAASPGSRSSDWQNLAKKRPGVPCQGHRPIIRISTHPCRDFALLAEIDENLIRGDLSPARRGAGQARRRKKEAVERCQIGPLRGRCAMTGGVLGA